MPLVTLPYELTANTTASASEVMGNFNALEDAINGNIESVNLADGSVSAGKIQSNAVTETKISDGAVTDAKIAGVAASKISGTIATSQVADSAITPVKTSFFDGTAIHAGTVLLDGTAGIMPTGWVSSKLSTGKYKVTHPYTNGTYVVVASAVTTERMLDVAYQTGYFEVELSDDTGTRQDTGFGFILVAV